MHFSKRQVSMFLLIACGMILSAGCQSIRDSNAKSTEEMLAAAGFQIKQGQTPEQLADLQDLPQRKLVPHNKDGQTMYVYGDAKTCQCVYVGTEANYQEYRKMVYQKDLADEQATTAEMNSVSMLDWGLWGPWGPWGDR